MLLPVEKPISEYTLLAKGLIIQIAPSLGKENGPTFS